VSLSLARAVALYAGCLAIFSPATAVRGRALGRAHAGMAIVVGAAAVLNALVAAVAIAAGARPAEAGPFAGYLLISVLAAPVGWRYARSSPSAWDAAIVALTASRAVRHLRPARAHVGMSAGAGRALVAAYAIFAVAAGARSSVQLAEHGERAPLAYGLSALAALTYLAATVALRSPAPRTRAVAIGIAAGELTGVLAVGAWSLLDPAAFPDETVWSRFGSGYGWVPLLLPVLALTWLLRARAASALP
jgi:hypothetical protein